MRLDKGEGGGGVCVCGGGGGGVDINKKGDVNNQHIIKVGRAY